MKIKIVLLLCLMCSNLFAQDTIISEDILVMNDSIKLPGTLTYNKALEQQPLVIFVHGSGPIDRDGNSNNLVNPAYIKQLKNSLTKRNIGFYSYDKRSARMENLTYVMKDMRFDAFIDDLNLIIDNFKDDKRFSSITLIGHSQGSLVSMLADHTNIAKFISLAGPSQSIENSIVAQTRLQNGDSIATLVQSHFKELSKKGRIENVDSNLMALFNKPMQPFWASWMTYDPSEEIKKIQLPILILNGDKDLQVYVSDAEMLHKANPESTLVIIKNMNHVLKTIEKESDNMASYQTPNFPLSQELVDTMTAFIKN